MSQHLLDLVQPYFQGDAARQISSALGEPEHGIGSALGTAVPLALGAILARSQQVGGLTELHTLAQQAHGSGVLENLSGLLGSTATGNSPAPPTAGLLGQGTNLLRSVLGLRYTPAVEHISQTAGVRPTTASHLLSMVVPVALALLGRHAATGGLQEQGVGTYLNEQRPSILQALSQLPGNLGAMLPGLGLSTVAAPDVVPGPTTAPLAREAANEPEVAAPAAPAQPSRARWPWLLLLVLGLAALWYFLQNTNRGALPTSPTTVADTTAAAEGSATPTPAPALPTGRLDDATGNYVYDVGPTTELRLPDGTELRVGANSVEVRLFNFLNDAGQTVSADNTQGWMSLDRVYFDTGKATLTPESQAQLRHIALILQAFPAATLKLGGYTDNAGPAEPNLLLSADRANAARKALLDAGVDPMRVQAEGYGQEHPLASNNTPEGRAQNRRVDVRVTGK